MTSGASSLAGGAVAYVDTSAYLKLLFAERESPTFEIVICEWPDLFSAELLDVEMHRAAYRHGLPATDCDDLLDAVNLVAVDEPIRRHARRIGQPVLRAADAIHLLRQRVSDHSSVSCSPTTGVCSTGLCWRVCRLGRRDRGSRRTGGFEASESPSLRGETMSPDIRPVLASCPRRRFTPGPPPPTAAPGPPARG